MKKTIIIVIIVLAAAALIILAAMWPLDSNENLGGTLAGVEKAEKYRGEQPTRTDLMISEDDVSHLTQSAEWQNAMKDKELVKFLQSEDFQKFMVMNSDMKKLLIAQSCFNTAKSYCLNNEAITVDPQNLSVMPVNTFARITTEYLGSFHYLLNNSSNPSAMNFDEALKLLYNNQELNISTAAFSADFQKLVLSSDFQKILSSPQFEKLTLTSARWMASFEKFVNANMLSLIFTIFSSDMQNSLSTLGNDFQKYVFSNDFQNSFKSLVFSSEYQNLLLSNDMHNAGDIFHSIQFNNSIATNFNSLMQTDVMNSISTYSRSTEDLVNNRALYKVMNP